jgi:hypothetical protein
MPAAKQAPVAKRAPAAPTRRGTAALDGLEVSLEEAQKALTDLRRDLSTGGRRLVKDVDTAIKSARRDLRRSRKAIQGDLGDLGDALTPRRAARKPAASTAKRKPSQKEPAGKA